MDNPNSYRNFARSLGHGSPEWKVERIYRKTRSYLVTFKINPDKIRSSLKSNKLEKSVKSANK